MAGLSSPPQTIVSSYTWGDLYGLVKRTAAGSASLTPQDQLTIVKKVSAFAYTRFPWPFTIATTGSMDIPCVDGQQDYPSPQNLRALTRAWFYVPTNQNGINYGTVPPYDDPNLLALAAAQASANYVGALLGGTYPIASIWPPGGSFTIVKRLGVNLYPVAYTAINAICQQPNSPLIRLNAATACPSSLLYYLNLEYQPVRPPVNSLTEQCWFPDDYVAMGQEGLEYELLRIVDRVKAGTAVYSPGGAVSYTGQLAVWMASMESAAAAERAGSVDTLTPTESLGSDYGSWGWGWFA